MNYKIVLATITFLLGSWARAQYYDTSASTSRSTVDSNVNSVQRSFAGYLGFGAGYSGYNSNIDVEGAPTSVKLLGSYVSESGLGVYDLGFGIHNQTFSQDTAIDSAISTGVLEVAARYQFENRWQLGAIYNQFFNKGENYSANQADVEFGGVQMMREFSFDGSYLGRAGGRIMSSLNVDNETVTMALIDFQIGWGGSGRRTTNASTY